MTPYPLSALVGSDDLVRALLLGAVSPAIGGVLVRGEKGTAKSTAVRGLAALLPAVPVVPGCPYSCDPAAPDPACPAGPHPPGEGELRAPRMVELPVGASQDRLAGSLDLERALTEGRRAFEPGLLAAAHRGLLYVDEVNLLPDALVDLLLDAAAMGTNTVEREGVSVRHAARFQLVGTMNPEEGELRPQLLDRFGVTVEVAASRDLAERAEVVRRRLAYEADPPAFAARWEEADRGLAERIVGARALLPAVELGDGALRAVVAACAAFEVDGMRADLVTAKAATAIAAWEGRTAVTVEDVRAAALLALPHRRRRQPFEQPGLDTDRLDEALEGLDDDRGPDGDGDGPPGGRGQGQQPTPDGGAGEQVSVAPPGAGDAPTGDPALATATGTATLPVGAGFDPVLLRLEGRGTGASGRRSAAVSPAGAAVGARPPAGAVRDLAAVATLTAAAPRQQERGRCGPGLVLRPEDLRETVREGREGNLVVFLVDASGSMAARQRMTAVKGAVRSLLLDAYRRRDRVGVVTFRGEEAAVVLPPTSSVDRAGALLAELPTGGRTPLAAGLAAAADLLARERVRDADRRALLVVLTDGRRTSGPDPATAAAHLAARGTAAVVVDTEDGRVRLGCAAVLAGQLGAPCLRLEELASGALARVVRMVTAGPGRAA